MRKIYLKPLLMKLAIVIAVSFLSSADSQAQDWNQWMGANRDSQWNDTGILSEFPEDGPKVLWRQEVATGYAGPAVVGDRVYVSDYVISEGENQPNPGRRTRLKGSERVRCLDAGSGEILWDYENDCEYSISYAYGPRATPTVVDGAVYVLGAEGRLSCLRADSGEEVWTKELKEEYGLAEAPIWGFAGHPLVHGDTLYALVGGEGSIAVAFDKNTGEEKWRALSAKGTGYCPPTMIRAGGVDQLLIWHPESINSLNPENGEVYWSVAIEPAYEMSIIAPYHSGDYLLLTALQNASMLLELDSEKPEATEVWRGKGLHPDHNPPVVFEDHIYGVDVKGRLRCISLVEGERQWESLATAPGGRPQSSTTGFIVRNNDQFFLATESGELIIARLSPEGYEELSRAKILEETSATSGRNVVWSHPAFANQCVYWRNDKEIVCVSLAK